VKAPLAIFYHCLFEMGEPPQFSETAFTIISEQMQTLKEVGLLAEASHFCVGLNGGEESLAVASMVIPEKAKIVLHGLQCHNECRTIREIEKWVPGHEGWNVLYFHAKGCTHPFGDPMRLRWRRCMENTVFHNWRQCVADLDSGFEVVGVHYMQPLATPPGQYIMAGNFWWAKASFLITLPSILKRDRIKQSGLDSVESRYESEVFIGNGPRPPVVMDYHKNWNPSLIGTCAP
jgi:hypothetical protein